MPKDMEKFQKEVLGETIPRELMDAGLMALDRHGVGWDWDCPISDTMLESAVIAMLELIRNRYFLDEPQHVVVERS